MRKKCSALYGTQAVTCVRIEVLMAVETRVFLAIDAFC